ncbi:MAG: hypothetical protein OEP95_03725, partial [Myxococcales bacterium]|nr:hypothetical protein [Myxococcales bacterium]
TRARALGRRRAAAPGALMQRAHRRVHARIWSVLVVALPLALLVALALRPNGPIEKKAVAIETSTTAAEASP